MIALASTWSSVTPIKVRWLSYILTAVVVAVTIIRLVHPTSLLLGQSHFTAPSSPPVPTPEQVQDIPPRFAFVAFLAAHAEGQEFEDDDEDSYFLATRVIGYQLMHAPETRTNSSIPFVVLATKGVSERKRARLEKDGAIVTVVDDVVQPGWRGTAGVPRWKDVMTKLRVFQLAQYEKILCLDADVLPVRRLDDVFQDPATEILQPQMDKLLEAGKATLPPTYMLAGQMGIDREHAFATEEEFWTGQANSGELNNINAGFLVAAPSQAIFDYYMSVLHSKEAHFDNYAPEQDLLRYVHSMDGPMPWKHVYYKWVVNSPVYKDYELGACSTHEKLWNDMYEGHDLGMDKLAALFDKARWEMQGYYRALEDPSPKSKLQNI